MSDGLDEFGLLNQRSISIDASQTAYVGMTFSRPITSIEDYFMTIHNYPVAKVKLWIPHLLDAILLFECLPPQSPSYANNTAKTIENICKNDHRLNGNQYYMLKSYDGLDKKINGLEYFLRM